MLHLSYVLVAKPFQSCVYYVMCFFLIPGCLCVCVQQIDEMLAGSLTQEDEEAVLAELEAITQVCTWTLSDSPCYWCCVSCCDFIYRIHVMCVRRKKLTLNFLRCLKKNYQRFQSKSQVCVFFSISVINVQHANAKNLFFYVSVREKAKKKPEMLAM